MFLLSGCAALPQLYQSMEDIADDDAIKIIMSKEAIQKQSNISISLNLDNTQTK
jgi:starvation-inducible outer membrane lipoprotein